MLAETDSSGNTQNEYVFFGGRRIAQRTSSGSVYFYYSDPLGTIHTITNGTGTACYDATFTPYGQEMLNPNISQTCSSNYKFTGYEYDSETGLYYAKARYYNPRLGRFMSADPLSGDVIDPQSLNRYAYVINAPTILTDPTGLDNCIPGKGAGRYVSCQSGGTGQDLAFSLSNEFGFLDLMVQEESGSIIEENGAFYYTFGARSGVTFTGQYSPDGTPIYEMSFLSGGELIPVDEVGMILPEIGGFATGDVGFFNTGSLPQTPAPPQSPTPPKPPQAPQKPNPPPPPQPTPPPPQNTNLLLCKGTATANFGGEAAEGWETAEFGPWVAAGYYAAIAGEYYVNLRHCNKAFGP